MNKFNKYLLATSSIILIFFQASAVGGPAGIAQLKLQAKHATLAIEAASKVQKYVNDKVKHRYFRTTPSIIDLKNTFQANAVANSQLGKDFASNKKGDDAIKQNKQVKNILGELDKQLKEAVKFQQNNKKEYIEHPNTPEAIEHNKGFINLEIKKIAKQYNEYMTQQIAELSAINKQEADEFIKTEEYKAAIQHLEAIGFKKKGTSKPVSPPQPSNVPTQLLKVATVVKKKVDLSSQNVQENQNEKILKRATFLLKNLQSPKIWPNLKEQQQL